MMNFLEWLIDKGYARNTIYSIVSNIKLVKKCMNWERIPDNYAYELSMCLLFQKMSQVRKNSIINACLHMSQYLHSENENFLYARQKKRKDIYVFKKWIVTDHKLSTRSAEDIVSFLNKDDSFKYSPQFYEHNFDLFTDQSIYEELPDHIKRNFMRAVRYYREYSYLHKTH